MSATEDQTSSKPEETKPAEAVPASETTAVATTAASDPAATEAEKAILTKDPVVVASALEKAEPVSAEPSTSAVAAPAETTAAADDTPAQGAPATPEKHKEGSAIIGFLKKHVPNPKTVDKKSSTKSTTEGKKTATDTTAKSEIEPVAPTTAPEAQEEETPLESDNVEFKTHGGFFSGGWKTRVLKFGKEDGYSQTSLVPYVGTHKLAAVWSSAGKANAAYDNAAHAVVTGVGLLFIVKSKAVDVPLNIINLADVTGVTVSSSHFTIKTELMGDYEFSAVSLDQAKKWKQELDTRVEQSKLTRPSVQESHKYKESLAYFKDMHSKAGHKSEAVTSDEEGAVSGEEGKRSGKWTRRISGSFQKFTGSSKDATTTKEATETPKEGSSAPEVAAAEPAAVPEPAAVTAEASEATESAVADGSADTAAEQSKKDKRKSLGGFAGLWKGKGGAKEASPEPTTKEVADDVPATAEAPAAAPAESSTGAEETPVPTEPKVTKRHSIFSGLLPKPKDKSTSTGVPNGDAPVAETSEPAPTTTETSAPAQPSNDDAEFKPTPVKKDSLSRRLTSQFKYLGRSKSPEKNKATKVSDEAPKIETAIGTTPEASTTTPIAVAAEEKKIDTIEPLATTEAPHTSTEPAPSTEHASVPEVSTKA